MKFVFTIVINGTADILYEVKISWPNPVPVASFCAKVHSLIEMTDFSCIHIAPPPMKSLDPFFSVCLFSMKTVLIVFKTSSLLPLCPAIANPPPP